MNINLIPILLPLFSALLILLISDRTKYLKELLAIGVSLTSLLSAFITLGNSLNGNYFDFKFNWLYNVSQFSLKADMLSAFILLSVSLFSFLISIYAFSFEKKGSSKWFYFNLLWTQSFASGTALSDSLISMLFFAEGLLISLYMFIALSGSSTEYKNTALKTFLINAVCDLCLMCGVIITGYLSGTFSMSEISLNRLSVGGWATFGYLLILVGAIPKIGIFPFHTWIPYAALYSNAPFMAYVPAAIDKLLGVYIIARTTLYIYKLDTFMSIIVMSLGAFTIIAAVMMAFVQKDYKRLLSYHAVSQAGYMVLGIGTLNPIGIAGALFHMINHAIYKSCLFMTAGSVERQTGTNDIEKLGGLFSRMPFTGVSYIISAAAISGIAPLNGFFSKELIYKGSLDTGYKIFFIAAEIGSFLTLASFLKLGHSVFFGKRPQELDNVKESPFSVIFPMGVLATLCLLFGFGSYFPIEFLISPSLLSINIIPAEELAGFHINNLFWISIIVILLAISNHILGFSLSGYKAFKASDHIHHAPILKNIYNWAEKRYFDIYEVVMRLIVPIFSMSFYKIDRFFDKIIDDIPSYITNSVSEGLAQTHTGSYSLYMAITFIGIILYLIIIGGMKW